MRITRVLSSLILEVARHQGSKVTITNMVRFLKEETGFKAVQIVRTFFCNLKGVAKAMKAVGFEDNEILEAARKVYNDEPKIEGKVKGYLGLA